jgi:hypothetical protein
VERTFAWLGSVHRLARTTSDCSEDDGEHDPSGHEPHHAARLDEMSQKGLKGGVEVVGNTASKCGRRRPLRRIRRI